MKVYRYWVHFANYYILLDVSGSMMRNEREAKQEGLQVVRALSRRLFSVAQRELSLYAFGMDFARCRVRTERALEGFLNGARFENVRSRGTILTSMFADITTDIWRGGVAQERVSHIYFVSDCDLNSGDYVLEPLVDMAETIPAPIQFHVHKVGGCLEGGRVLEALKRDRDTTPSNIKLVFSGEAKEEEGPDQKRRRLE